VLSFRRILILALVSLSFLGLVEPRSESMFSNGYTHALLDEHFGATWCPSCLTDEPNVMKVYNDFAGSFFVVSYHISDEFSNASGEFQSLRYQAHSLPYHVFDGGYWTGKGTVYYTDMKAPATRPVHRIGLAINKVINSGTLEYEGSVQEMDGKPFVGYVRVYITENKLHSEGIEWNFVFRAFGISKQLAIGPNAFTLFSGTWAISSNVMAENVLVVAAVFDNSTVGYYGPYAVQAIDDNKSGHVIPEMTAPTQVAIMTLLIGTVVFGMRRYNQVVAH
jgi:hypothetical protein